MKYDKFPSIIQPKRDDIHISHKWNEGNKNNKKDQV